MISVPFVSLEILSQSSETEFRREDVRGGVIVDGGVVLVLTFALLLRLNLLSSVVAPAADFTRFFTLTSTQIHTTFPLSYKMKSILHYCIYTISMI